jgi:hypothetical protein
LITILKEKPSNDVLLDGTGSYVVKPVMNKRMRVCFKTENG